MICTSSRSCDFLRRAAGHHATGAWGRATLEAGLGRWWAWFGGRPRRRVGCCGLCAADSAALCRVAAPVRWWRFLWVTFANSWRAGCSSTLPGSQPALARWWRACTGAVGWVAARWGGSGLPARSVVSGFAEPASTVAGPVGLGGAGAGRCWGAPVSCGQPVVDDARSGAVGRWIGCPDCARHGDRVWAWGADPRVPDGPWLRAGPCCRSVRTKFE